MCAERRRVVSLVISVGALAIIGCGGSSPSLAPTPTPASPATSAVKIEVWALEAHHYKGDTGDVLSITIDGTNLALTRTVSADKSMLTVDATAQLTPGSHTAFVSMSNMVMPTISLVGSVSNVQETQGPPLSQGGPGAAGAVWVGYPTATCGCTIGVSFTVR